MSYGAIGLNVGALRSGWAVHRCILTDISAMFTEYACPGGQLQVESLGLFNCWKMTTW